MSEADVYKKLMEDLEKDLKDIDYEIKRLKNRIKALRKNKIVVKSALVKYRKLISKLNNKSGGK